MEKVIKHLMLLMIYEQMHEKTLQQSKSSTE